MQRTIKTGIPEEPREAFWIYWRLLTGGLRRGMGGVVGAVAALAAVSWTWKLLNSFGIWGLVSTLYVHCDARQGFLFLVWDNRHLAAALG